MPLLEIVFVCMETVKNINLKPKQLKSTEFPEGKKTTVLVVIILTVYLAGTLVYSLMLRNEPENLSVELWEIIRCAISLVDIFIYAWKVPKVQEGYRKILSCRTNRIVPWYNVQSCRMNFPLVPRRNTVYEEHAILTDPKIVL